MPQLRVHMLKLKKDPTVTGQLSPCATATDAHVPRAREPQQEKPPQWEARALQLESSPHLPEHSNKDPVQP